MGRESRSVVVGYRDVLGASREIADSVRLTGEVGGVDGGHKHLQSQARVVADRQIRTGHQDVGPLRRHAGAKLEEPAKTSNCGLSVRRPSVRGRSLYQHPGPLRVAARNHSLSAASTSRRTRASSLGAEFGGPYEGSRGCRVAGPGPRLVGRHLQCRGGSFVGAARRGGQMPCAAISGQSGCVGERSMSGAAAVERRTLIYRRPHQRMLEDNPSVTDTDQTSAFGGGQCLIVDVVLGGHRQQGGQVAAPVGRDYLQHGLGRAGKLPHPSQERVHDSGTHGQGAR